MDGWHYYGRSIWQASTSAAGTYGTSYSSSPSATMPTGEHLYPRREQLFGNMDRQQRQPVALDWRGVYQLDSATFKSAAIIQ